jgi:hypothetical protein
MEPESSRRGALGLLGDDARGAGGIAMTLIERVARAIFRSRFTGPYEVVAHALFGRVLTYDELVEFTATGLVVSWTLDNLRAEAKEYIAAMREPTEAMEKAMEESDFEGWSPEPGEGRDYLSLTTAWKAGIDAALAEKP